MIDTIQLTLPSSATEESLIIDTPYRLNDVAEHIYPTGVVLTGAVPSATSEHTLTVSLTAQRLRLTRGSLCKWYKGNNYCQMTRQEVQHAVEALSDTLHLPMAQAQVTRLDVGCNIITRYPCATYYKNFGPLTRACRLSQPDGILYKGRDYALCIYDKNREQHVHHEPIPEEYRDKNVMRIEARCQQRLTAYFHRKVAAATLADPFFFDTLRQWLSNLYSAIVKIPDISPAFSTYTGRRDFYTLAVLALVERCGGQQALTSTLVDAHRRGFLTTRQCSDLQQVVAHACLQPAAHPHTAATAEIDSLLATALADTPLAADTPLPQAA